MVSTEPTNKVDAEPSSRSQTLFWGLISTVVLIYFVGLAFLTWYDNNRAPTRAEVELEHFS